MKYLTLLSFLLFFACGNTPEASTEAEPTPATGSATAAVEVLPIYHGSVVLRRGEEAIYVDPHGGAERYAGLPAPSMVLISHTHSDHLDSATLAGIDLSNATLVAPQAVVDAITDNNFRKTVVLANGENYAAGDVDVDAVPAYNLTEGRLDFHPEGKFNGYVLTYGGDRYYFSGDTEDVPEIRSLEDIDYAFVCMNQPYTMTLDQAVSTVLDFAPEVVYPYHYRNKDESRTDVAEFKRQIEAGNQQIEVRLEEWYSEAGK